MERVDAWHRVLGGCILGAELCSTGQPGRLSLSSARGVYGIADCGLRIPGECAIPKGEANLVVPPWDLSHFSLIFHLHPALKSV
jgi:hypothetical protein